MVTEILFQIETGLAEIYNSGELSKTQVQSLLQQSSMDMLSYGPDTFDVLVNQENGDLEIRLQVQESFMQFRKNGKPAKPSILEYAVAEFVLSAMEKVNPADLAEGRAYTRSGMIRRVLQERRAKAEKAEYKIKFANNLYGEHILTNEQGVKYKITLRDFVNETGYIDNPDYRHNKLGTTKHIMFAFRQLKAKPALMKKMSKEYPFIEIYCDPLNDYLVSYYYPHSLPKDAGRLIRAFFGKGRFLEASDEQKFLNFIDKATAYPAIKIRTEVREKVEKAWNRALLEQLEMQTQPDWKWLKAEPFPYQKEGIVFATYREGAIIADEMGLGKTFQAIAAAVCKKHLLGFKKTMVICPASIKGQWKSEIEKYSREHAEILDGWPDERALRYRQSTAFFHIVNYETVLRDWHAINKADYDLIILDEAQRIKNFDTITAQSIKQLQKKHSLVITGTPIENKLVDLYSIMQFVNPELLGPLWEFSYQHCYFDTNKHDKITGYYNLQQLNEKLKQVIIRREKRKVLKQLPEITQYDIPVAMSLEQRDYHTSFARALVKIITKKYLTPADLQQIQLLLGNMRMVCDSTYLIDKETNHSPKLHELRYVLEEQMQIKQGGKKIIIFSEWVTMLGLIGEMLKNMGITYVQLSGKVAVKNRQALVKKFEEDPACQIFLSSEAGGVGLNLQMADTVINFELPWNPGKKNQRIGRIDRLGQRSKHLTVVNFITNESIESRIAEGLTLKQSLFDGVLNEGNRIDTVDFSTKGRSQFLKQLDSFIGSMAEPVVPVSKEDELEETMAVEAVNDFDKLADLAAKDEIFTEAQPQSQPEEIQQPKQKITPEMESMQTVMESGMQFLAGLYKLSTGKDMPAGANSVEIDANTGEVVMRFKMKP
jgi:SNF2 family DNA or RNA helicase